MKDVLTRSVVRPADDPKTRNRRVKFRDQDEKDLEKIDLQHEDFKHDKPLQPAENEIGDLDNEVNESNENNEDDNEEDNGIATRTRSKRQIVGALNTQTVKHMSEQEDRGNLMYWLTIPTAILFLLTQILFWIPENGTSIPDITEQENFKQRVLNSNKNHMAQLKYIHACDKWQDDLEDPWDTIEIANKDLWNAKRVLAHRIKDDNTTEVKVQWKDPNKSTSWVDLYSLALQDPTEILRYAKNNHLLSQKPFSIITNYCVGETPSQLVRAFKAKTTAHRGQKYKFGVRVPFGVKQAMQLDKENGNTLWLDAIKKELDCLNEWKVFRILDEGEQAPEGYKKIPYHIVFDVKFQDLRHRARLVAGGNWNALESDETYSGVVGMDTVRMGFMLGELNNLKCCAADVSSAYLHGLTREKVYFVAGPEFGELEGRILIIYKSIYGLSSSGARWHEVLSDKLRRMGFTPTKADADLWIRDRGDHYEYIASYVDDLLIWTRDENSILDDIRKEFDLKNVGPPDYYLGGNVEYLTEHWTKENIGLGFSGKTYIENMIPKFEELFGTNFKSLKTPMAADYHPETDDSPLLSDDDAAKYRSIIGSLNWLVTLGRFDVHYATNTLSRYGMAPREGHLVAAQKVLCYLKTFPKGKILFDTSYPVHHDVNHDDLDWTEFYPDAEEELPPDMPDPRGKPVRITVYLDADHAHDVVTRRSVTGILMLLNNTPIKWVCKRQKTVETSTYGSELVAARIATEMVMALRYQLRMLGIPIDGPAMMFGDNQSVVLNTTVPSSVLKKKHHACAYHRVREAIAAKIIKFQHIKSTENFADLLTKPLGGPEFHALVKPYLFRNPK